MSVPQGSRRGRIVQWRGQAFRLTLNTSSPRLIIPSIAEGPSPSDLLAMTIRFREPLNLPHPNPLPLGAGARWSRAPTFSIHQARPTTSHPESRRRACPELDSGISRVVVREKARRADDDRRRDPSSQASQDDYSLERRLSGVGPPSNPR